VKFEHALSLLPNVEGFLPLRLLLLESASSDRHLPDGPGSLLTVGKHEVTADAVRTRMAYAMKQTTKQFAVLSEVYVHALECIERGTPAEAVDDLIRAGRSEEKSGRVSQAREWYAVALRVAGALRDRRPESAVQLDLARLNMRAGATEDAERCYRRSLDLADADGDWGAEIRACEGLGEIGALRGLYEEAQAWYARAIHRAEGVDDESRTASLRVGLAIVLRAAGRLDAASESLRQARASFEDIGAAEAIVRALCVQAEIERDLNRPAESAATYREALAWSYRTDGRSSLGIRVHVGLARLHLHTERWLDAESELRESEWLAISAGRVGWLVRIYTVLGTLRGQRGDAEAFVFFEQALEFARMLGGSPVFEARIYVEYGAFKNRMQQPAEARAFLNRAQLLFAGVGAAGEAQAVERQLGLIHHA
jgi:tetratricopeptide (TPR) repeat protein